jgi:hypothetical protein
MNLETIVTQVDRHGAHLGGNLAVAPAVEDPPSIRTKGDNVPEDLELGEGLVDFDVVALPVAFYCGCETAKSCLLVNFLVLGEVGGRDGGI